MVWQSPFGGKLSFAEKKVYYSTLWFSSHVALVQRMFSSCPNYKILCLFFQAIASSTRQEPLAHSCSPSMVWCPQPHHYGRVVTRYQNYRLQYQYYLPAALLRVKLFGGNGKPHPLLNAFSINLVGKTTTTRSLPTNYSLDLPPTQDASHHQDKYIVSLRHIVLVKNS